MTAPTTSRRTRTPRRMAAAVALLAVLSLPFAAQAQPKALNQVAQSAEVVVIVPNLAQLNQELAALKQALGLPVPGLENVLGLFKRQTGMVQGLDENGSLLLVIENLPAAMQANSKPQMTLLVPVRDYAAFLGNYAGNAAEPIASLILPSGQTAFARQLDGYALLGESRDVVEAYQPAGDASALTQSLGTLGQRYLGEADVAVYVDLERLAPALLPQLEENLAQVEAQFEQMAQAGVTAPGGVENAKAMVGLYSQAARNVLQSADGGLIALDLDDAGIALTYGLKYKPGSPVAEFLPGGGHPLSETLARLPAQPFIFTAAVDTDAVALADLMEHALEAIAVDDAGPVLAIYRQSLPLLRQTGRVATAYYTPTQATMMSGGLLNAITVYEADDPQQYTQQIQQLFTSLNGLSLPLAPAPGSAPGSAPANQITYTTSYTENALQVDDVRVDQYQLQMTFPPQMQQQMMPMMMMLGGNSGYNGYIAAADGHVIVTTSTDPLMLRAALQTLKKPTGIGAAGPIAAIRDQAVTPDPAFVGYVSLQGIAQTVNLYLPMFTGRQPIVVPDNLPPLAISAAVQDGSTAFRLYLPMDALRFVQGAVGPWMGQMHGPGAQPPQGGTPPAPF